MNREESKNQDGTTPVDPAALPAVFSESVKARFPDIPDITLHAPALDAGRNDFTSQSELENFVQQLGREVTKRTLKSGTPALTLSTRTIGYSTENRAILQLRFSGEPSDRSKLTVWVVAQQHGDEPAACEAALELAYRVVHGEFDQALQTMDLIIVPRVNPDGAAHQTRTTVKNLDMNRDHLCLELVESIVLHEAMAQDPPDVVLDLHEFTAGGAWEETYGAVQSSDYLFQCASHPLMSSMILQFNREVLDPILSRALSQYGLRNWVYNHINVDQVEQPVVQMGGNLAGIGRNAFGLKAAIAYLLESRGIGIGRDHYQRRVASHWIAVQTLLNTLTLNHERVRELLAQSRQAVSSALIIEHQAQREMLDVPMLDPKTGVDKPTRVMFQDSTRITPTLVRDAPLGYLISATQHEALKRLSSLGVEITDPPAADGPLLTQAYSVKSVQEIPATDDGVAQKRFVCEVRDQEWICDPKWRYVPLAQRFWRVVVTALEPEGVGSYASVDLVDPLQVLRLMPNPAR